MLRTLLFALLGIVISTFGISALAETVRLKDVAGTYLVPVQVNGKISLYFTLDSGATDVSIPADVFSTLVRTGTVSKDDIRGRQVYRLADGSEKRDWQFVIRSLRVGKIELRNVIGSVAPAAGPLLLGQSFLARFSTWSVNNQRHVLILERRRKLRQASVDSDKILPTKPVPGFDPRYIKWDAVDHGPSWLEILDASADSKVEGDAVDHGLPTKTGWILLGRPMLGGKHLGPWEYIDTTRIGIDGDIRRAWFKAFPEDKPKSNEIAEKYSLNLEAFNCKARTMLWITSLMKYVDGTQQVYPQTDSWEPALPESMGEGMLNFVCDWSPY